MIVTWILISVVLALVTGLVAVGIDIFAEKASEQEEIRKWVRRILLIGLSEYIATLASTFIYQLNIQKLVKTLLYILALIVVVLILSQVVSLFIGIVIWKLLPWIILFATVIIAIWYLRRRRKK